MGYNGFFSGAPHESIMAHGHEQVRDQKGPHNGRKRQKNKATVHAEQNAISHAARTGIALLGAVAYVTHYPCCNCFKSLVAAGIQHVSRPASSRTFRRGGPRFRYYIDDYRNDDVNAQLSRVSGIVIEQLVQEPTPTPGEQLVQQPPHAPDAPAGPDAAAGA
jgi:deoxycytidylate deaminase